MQNYSSDPKVKTYTTVTPGEVGGILRNWEQGVLCKKFDCEESVLCRQISKFIMWRKAVAANSYLKHLDEIRGMVNFVDAGSVLPQREILWAQVFQKIANEEHASILLGSRRRDARGQFIRRLLDASYDFSVGSKRRYGASALAITSAIAFGVYLGSPQIASLNKPSSIGTGYSREAYIPPQIIPDVEPVSLGGSRQSFGSDSYRPQIFSNPSGSQGAYVQSPMMSQNVSNYGGSFGPSGRPVSLDWLRSKGSVSFIEDGQRNMPILWVSKKNQEVDKSPSRHRRNPSIVRRHQ